MNNKEFRQRLVIACVQGAMACNQGSELMTKYALSKYAVEVAKEVEIEMNSHSAFRDLLQDDQ